MAIGVEFSRAHKSHPAIGKDAHGFALRLTESIGMCSKVRCSLALLIHPVSSDTHGQGKVYKSSGIGENNIAAPAKTSSLLDSAGRTVGPTHP